MGSLLELTKASASLFWKISVTDNEYTITYGNIGTAGKSIHKSCDDHTSAEAMALKLMQSKLNKGYVKVNLSQPNNVKKPGWFEILAQRVLKAYESAILSLDRGHYTSIRLTYRDDGFGLGLNQGDQNKNWEWIDLSISDTQEKILSFYSFVDDEDYETNQPSWPHNESDCCYLEGLLASVALGKAYLALRQNTEFDTHLSSITHLYIDADDRQDLPFTHYYATKELRKKVISQYVAYPDNQQLILDLWGDQLNGNGVKFLMDLDIKYTKQTDSDLVQLNTAYKKAKDLFSYYQEQMAIDLLKPQVEALSVKKLEKYNLILEKCNALLAKCDKDLK